MGVFTQSLGFGTKPGQVTLAAQSNPSYLTYLSHLGDVCAGHKGCAQRCASLRCVVCVLLMHYIIIRASVGDLTANPESVEIEIKKKKDSVDPGLLLVEGKKRKNIQ